MSGPMTSVVSVLGMNESVGPVLPYILALPWLQSSQTLISKEYTVRHTNNGSYKNKHPHLATVAL